MVNAILDYVLLLDRLIIKWFIYIAIWMIGPLLSIIFNIIDDKRQSIQNDILKYDNINELVKVMNDSGYTYDEIREAFNEEGIEWLKM